MTMVVLTLIATLLVEWNSLAMDYAVIKVANLSEIVLGINCRNVRVCCGLYSNTT